MGYRMTEHRRGVFARAGLAMAALAVVCVGCSDVQGGEAAEAVVPTTMVAGGGTAGGSEVVVEVRDLPDPAAVEALVREFGRCVTSQVPDAAMAIWFDVDSGYVGSTHSLTRTTDASDRLGLAVDQCDTALAYRRSINAYIEANPDAGERGPSGLPVDRGEQLTFGDQTLLQSLLG